MFCFECGSKMYLDDKDFSFKGKFDNYWNCPNCQTSCIEEVRFSQVYRLIWHCENDFNNVKDYIFIYKKN